MEYLADCATVQEVLDTIGGDPSNNPLLVYKMSRIKGAVLLFPTIQIESNLRMSKQGGLMHGSPLMDTGSDLVFSKT